MRVQAQIPLQQQQPQPPLVVHIVHRFDTGGLENGIVNLINHMPTDRYRHAVLALTEVTDFRHRIKRAGVQFHALNKRPGQGLWHYLAVVRLLRAWRPAVVHTRNLGALEFQLPAWLAGVPARVHGEHGRDVGDLDGSNRSNRRLRRLFRPLVHHHIALSPDLTTYLTDSIGVPTTELTEIRNGVDTESFRPHSSAAEAAGESSTRRMPFGGPGIWIVGTVGRMHPVKNQTLLARAFVRLFELAPELKGSVRLVMIGDGPLRPLVQSIFRKAGLPDEGSSPLIWLPGERSDVASLMPDMHCFVLPSLAEGLSNTILEAMACGLPVIATAVGGNVELVCPGKTGELILAESVDDLACRLLKFARDPSGARVMGLQGRFAVQEKYSMDRMVNGYLNVYDRVLERKGRT